MIFIENPNVGPLEQQRQYQSARYAGCQKEEPKEKLKAFDRIMRKHGWIIFLTDIEHFSKSEIKRYNRKFRLGV